MVPLSGLPAVLKTRTLGYDGKGQKVLRQPQDVVGAFAELGSVPHPSKASVVHRRSVAVAVRPRWRNAFLPAGF